MIVAKPQISPAVIIHRLVLYIWNGPDDDITDEAVLVGSVKVANMNDLTNNKRAREQKDHPSSKHQRCSELNLTPPLLRKIPFPRTFHEPFDVGMAQRLLDSDLLREESDEEGKT